MDMELIDEAADAEHQKERRKRYEKVNAVGLPKTPLDPREAVAAARILYRLGRKLTDRPPRKVKRIRVTSGNRYTLLAWGEPVVNPERGWHGLVHDISHNVVTNHSNKHEWLERQLAEEVARRGWLDGRLIKARAVKPKPPVADVRYARVLARLAAWEAKRKRAETAIKKLNRQRAYYERKRAA